MSDIEQVQITEEEDEAFVLQQGEVDASLAAVREALNKKSLTTICVECGDPIGDARKKAVPSATLCIDCQEFLDKKR
jgi:phage/conjugal plasmid C-4 type zinc finger TraR family protein